jgi:hypothetical protein
MHGARPTTSVIVYFQWNSAENQPFAQYTDPIRRANWVIA